jgi:hypothetical protein
VEDEAAKPTHIAVLGFCATMDVFLGAAPHARDRTWLDNHKIYNLVKCIHRQHGVVPGPAKTAAGYPYDRYEVEIGLEWEDLQEGEHYFNKVRLDFQELSTRTGSILFWCKRGRHRSAAMLSMYMLFIHLHEDPDSVMAHVARRRDRVEFFEGRGKYPPLAKVVRWWKHWLMTKEMPQEALELFR